MKRIFLFIMLLALLQPLAAESFPAPGWKENADPAACPDEALAGGTFCESPGPSPKSLNYYLDNNTMSSKVFSLLYETLLNMDPATLDYVPSLASRWEISEDGMTFTFWIDPKARWSDGVPVTAADVEWTYQAIVNPRNLTGPFKYQMERLEAPVILEDGGIRFRAKSVHWQNLSAVSGFAILPKHVYADKDFNLINFDFPVVSGPCRVTDFSEGLYMELEKRGDWWRRDYPAAAGTLNFQRIRLRFFADQANAFDAFMKGELDYFPIYTASQWHKLEERSEAVRKNWIVKQAVHNHAPVGLQGFAMNLRRPLFQDRRVRLALAHLLDREFMNRTMMFSQYFLHRSYWEDLYDEQHPNGNPLIAFNPGEARRLLAEAGWKFNPESGKLEKDGKPFEFTFLNRGGNDRFLAVYNEALKNAGITMKIVNKDWSAWAKDMDEYNFDMTWAAWGSGLFKDPEQLWSSGEAKRKGSSNITGFSNPEADALIEKQKTIFNVAERNEILRQIDGILCREVPYILLWNINYSRILYWNKFGTPPAVMSKYGQDSALALWWNDPDRADELREAMKSGTPLPQEPAQVRWE